MKCKECGMEIGKKVNIDIYKHTVNCFNLEDKGIEQLLDQYAEDNSERGMRIKTMLLAAQKGE